MRFRTITDYSISPIMSIAYDKAIIKSCRENNDAVLRLYTWAPHGISIGSSMRWDMANIAKMQRDDISLVRRTTMGGGIYSGGDEVNATLVIPADWFEKYTPTKAFCFSAKAIGSALEKLGLKTAPAEKTFTNEIRNLDCFSEVTECEMTVGGRKLVGSASGYFQRLHIHQFQISLHGDCFKQIRNYSSVPVEETQSPICLCNALGRDIPLEEVWDVIQMEFEELLGADIEEGLFTDEETSDAELFVSQDREKFWRI